MQTSSDTRGSEYERDSSYRRSFDRMRDMVPFGPEEIDLRQLLLTLWRRKMVVFSTIAVVTVLTALVLFQVEPRYTATAQVMIDTRQSKVVDIESVVSGISAEMATLLSEVEVIRSPSLIARVVEKLNLTQDPEFNGALREPSWTAKILNLETYVSRDLLVSLGLRSPSATMIAADRDDRIESSVIGAIQGSMSVRPVNRSLVISIAFTSTDARKAALIANTITDNYIVDQLEAKFEATRRATTWLNDRLVSLKEKLRVSEAAVERYRVDVADKIGQQSRLTEQQLSELNSQLILARAKGAEAKARLNQVEDLLASEGNLNSAAEVLNSPLIQRLRDQESQVLREMSDLSSRYGPRHPKMIKTNAELKELRANIGREVRKIAFSLQNEMKVANVREQTLEKSLAVLEGKSAEQSRAEVRLRELEREAEANRLLYENFLSRFKETSEQEDLQQADARVIARASTPSGPSFPKKKLVFILAIFSSALLGVALVFVLERLDNSFRSAEQLEQQTGLASIGMVPLVAGIANAKKIARHILDKPTSSVSESVRNLRTSLVLSKVDEPPKVIGVTSTVPSEGKSTLALWLAESYANSGQKVLLIDADLRRPKISTLLNLETPSGIIELLTNQCSTEEAVKRVGSTGLHILSAKPTKADALDLLSSQRMANYVKTFREHFDMVIIDSPPILAVADAKVTGNLVDKILYIVKWDSTPRQLVLRGIKTAHEAGLDIAGTVLTQVNLRKHSRYGYGDHGYYYGKYKNYYTS